MTEKIEGLSEHDRLLEDELNKCTDAYRCYQISQEAESRKLAMMADYKCVRLYRQEEYSAGLL